jgi:hypothetical protein
VILLHLGIKAFVAGAPWCAQAQTDGRKRHVPEVIPERAGEASSVVADLMSYARPPAPQIAPTAVGQVIDEPLPRAGRRAGSSTSTRKSTVLRKLRMCPCHREPTGPPNYGHHQPAVFSKLL